MRGALILSAFLLLAVQGFAQTAPPDSSAKDSLRDSRRTRPGVIDLDKDPFYTKDSLALAQDSLKIKQDSVKNAQAQGRLDSLRRTSPLETIISYEAKDSMSLDLSGKRMYLYNTAVVDYGTSKMEAAKITLDWAQTLMTAEGKPDSLGEKFEGEPVFTDAGQAFNNHHVVYNYRTKKGKVVDTKSQQGESVFRAIESKRTPDGNFYGRGGIFTTCTAPHPHFYIRSSRVKIIPGKKFISGPLYLAIADVPLPLGLPFGFFPQREERQGGLIFPTFGQDNNRGFNLRNFGYYFLLGRYADLSVRGDVYSNASYRLELNSNYNKLYKYSGNILFSYALNNVNQRDDPDFSQNTDFQLAWSHNQPINPTTSLTASVNYTSSGYLQNNSFTVQGNRANNAFVTNNTNSSINLSKRYPRAGWTLNVSGTHSSDLVNKRVTLNFPTLAWSRTKRLFPFKGRNQAGTPKWYETIGVSYTGRAVNSVSVAESNLFKQAMYDSLKNGAVQNVGINTSFKALGFITISPSISYREYWYGKTLNPISFVETDFVDYANLPESSTDTVYQVNTTRYRAGYLAGNRYGFQTARDFSLNVSANTAIYGVLQTKGPRQRAYRHTIRPTIGFSYTPDFSQPSWGYYVPVPEAGDSTGGTTLISRFTNSVVGGPGSGLQQVFSFNLQNILETKVLEKQDTTIKKRSDEKPKFKYSNIIDNFGFGISYNAAADSFRLSTIPFSIRTSVLNNRIAINFGATLDPYAYSEAARRRIATLEYNKNGKIGRWTSFTAAITFNLTSPKSESKRPVDSPLSPEEEQLLEEDPANLGLPPELINLQRFRSLYTDFDIPWSLGVNYGYTYSRPTLAKGTISQNVNFNGTLRLTNKWMFSVQSGWDFDASALSTTFLNITRDLHCWDVSFTSIPFGTRTNYSILIRVKSSMLQDLKVNKRRDWQDGFVGQ